VSIAEVCDRARSLKAMAAPPFDFEI